MLQEQTQHMEEHVCVIQNTCTPTAQMRKTRPLTQLKTRGFKMLMQRMTSGFFKLYSSNVWGWYMKYFFTEAQRGSICFTKITKYIFIYFIYIFLLCQVIIYTTNQSHFFLLSNVKNYQCFAVKHFCLNKIYLFKYIK